MTANLILENAHVFTVTDFEVRIGEKFGIDIVGPSNEAAPNASVEWFSNHDAVLKIDENLSGSHADIVATQAGTSTIQLQVDGHTELTLKVLVFDPQQATSLNPVVGTPVLR